MDKIEQTFFDLLYNSSYDKAMNLCNELSQVLNNTDILFYKVLVQYCRKVNIKQDKYFKTLLQQFSEDNKIETIYYIEIKLFFYSLGSDDEEWYKLYEYVNNKDNKNKKIYWMIVAIHIDLEFRIYNMLLKIKSKNCPVMEEKIIDNEKLYEEFVMTYPYFTEILLICMMYNDNIGKPDEALEYALRFKKLYDHPKMSSHIEKLIKKLK